MTIDGERRRALRLLTRGAAAGAATLVAGAASAGSAAARPNLLPRGAGALAELAQRLAAAPRRRSFKTTPMILTAPEQWDHEALSEVLAYRPPYKQAWDVTDVAGPWLGAMRNALNAQIWSFRHPDFLVVVECHGTAGVALYDQAMWNKHDLGRLTGGRFSRNALIEERPAQKADPVDFEDPAGAFSAADDSIPALMQRGVVFMACHNAIWEHAGALIEGGPNSEGLSHGALAAELTNHLVPGVVLTPGAVATLPELQAAGFHYIK